MQVYHGSGDPDPAGAWDAHVFLKDNHTKNCQATDELGILAAENPHYVTDLHATVLTQLGLDPHSLEIPGRKRLDFEFGRPIREIIA